MGLLCVWVIVGYWFDCVVALFFRFGFLFFCALIRDPCGEEIKFKNLTALDLAYFTGNHKIIDLINNY